MLITSFDLYWNEKSYNHGINIYHDIFFDWKNLQYKHLLEKKVWKNELTNILNKSDYKICHNFYWYDWPKLPSLENHHTNNIDTLLIDSLISLNKTHHNLKKSINNTPLEDAHSTFKVLEKNLIKFHNFPFEIKNILYSLLIKCEKYNDFFIFYNKLTWEKLKILDKTEIIENISDLLDQKQINSSENIKLLEKYLIEEKYSKSWSPLPLSKGIDSEMGYFSKNSTNKLALAYLVIFIYKNTALLPDFILNSNIKLKDELRGLLNNFYSNISKKLNDNIKFYLKEFSWFESFRWETQIKWVSNSLENNDFLTILSTWGWKSLIYQLPAWLVWKKLWHLTLIITPLKALIKDQIDWLRNKNFNEVNYLSWDQNAIEKDMIHNKVKSWETKILFITPESLRNEKILELLQNRYISRIVVDEAHTLILWGQEFRPDYFFIKHFLNDIQSRNLNNKINLTLLTATATVDVEKWIKDYFKERDIKLIKAKELLKENIKWSVINITNESDKIDILLKR